MKEQLIRRLKEFYELEEFQVSYYQAQTASAEDPYYRQAFAKMVKIESDHANYFASKLLEQQVEIPKIKASLASMAGKLLGEAVEISGEKNTCKLGKALENKAISMYHDFINEARGETELQDKLFDYLLDEEFHALWLQNYALRQEKKKRLDDMQIIGPENQEHPTLNVNMRLL